MIKETLYQFKFLYRRGGETQRITFVKLKHYVKDLIYKFTC
jgi:hypothetical protein